jgi:hypothetical protein
MSKKNTNNIEEEAKVKTGKNFLYYPDFEDKDFYEKIYIKKEFYKNKIPKQQRSTEEICNARLFQLAPQQEFLRNYISIDTPYNGILIYHGTGIGKCLAYDTPVIMFNGEQRKVQDIQLDEFLMGDDNNPRKILSLARGRDNMYKIIPEKGAIYTVNSEHILCLKDINNVDNVIEIAVKDYLELSEEKKANLRTYKAKNLVFFNKWITEEDINGFEPKTKDEFLEKIVYKYGVRINAEKSVIDLLATQFRKLFPLNGVHKNYKEDNHWEVYFVLSYQLQPFRVECVGEGDYYGFTLDGNCRFLFGDTTVTHNTCSAVQIAEGFKDIMKRMHSDEKRKITVLLSRRIMPSFRDQIYDIKKELKKEKPDDIVQCTGNTYSLDFEQYSGLTSIQKRKETSRAVNNVYKFYGYEQFANEIMLDIGWNGKLNTLTDAQKRAIQNKFTNRILIIDEIHNIKNDTGSGEIAKVLRKVPPILQAVIRYGMNIRLVLMSATPMYDNAGEIIYILNLLLENDGRDPIKKSEIFDSEDNFVPGGEERLRTISKGYISYLRGENPVVFPMKITPLSVRTPKLKYDIYGLEIPAKNRMESLKLNMCKMSEYQWEQYYSKLSSKMDDIIENNNSNIEEDEIEEDNWESKNTAQKDTDEKFTNSVLRQFSNIILPNKAGNYALPKIDAAYQKTDNGDGTFIIDMGHGKPGERGKRKTYQFRYMNHVKMDFGKKNETGFLDERYLRKYSVKFAEILRNIRYGKGICYVYSEFVLGGVVPLAMMLEQNGFERYPWSGERPLLDYSKKRNPICAICGEGALNEIHEDTKNSDFHEFKRARYILVTGNSNISVIETGNLLNIVNNDNNMNGEEVKVIIGTRTTGEGLDFKRIRQVHILEPWFNLSRLDQIIGRSSRFCSHADLPKKDQNVEIFLYAVEPPDSAGKKNIETETIDTRIYRLAEVKDRKIKKVEYILKQAAVDCALNKNGNIFDFDGKQVEMVSSSGRKIKLSMGDVNGSRECDYRDCNYKCVWEPNVKVKYKINIDTYNERFAKSDIQKCKSIIKSIFKYGYVFTLNDIIKVIELNMKNLERVFMYISISDMIDNVNEPVYDMYDRRGYLIYRGNYYVFQPMEFNYLEAPLRYRMRPFQVKESEYMISNNSFNENNYNLTMKNKEIDRDNFDSVILKAEKIEKTFESNFKDKMYIILTMLVDKMNDKDKSNLLKKIILDYYETKGKMSSPYYVMLFRYFEPILIYKYRDLEVGKSNVEDKVIGFYYIFTDVKNDEKMIMKFFCYNSETKLINECPSDIRERIKLNMKIKLTKEVRNKVNNFNIIYGFMTLKGGPYVFKIFDSTRDTGAFTLKMEKSKRAEVKGKECIHHAINELEEVATKLKIKWGANTKKSKVGLCFVLEYELRRFELERIGGKRWFSNAIEDMKKKFK